MDTCVHSEFCGNVLSIFLGRKFDGRRKSTQSANSAQVMMFREIDEDGTGTLTKQEFLDVMDDTMFLIRLQSLDLEIADLPDCWNICDDGDGCVEQMEFIYVYSNSELERIFLTSNVFF